MTDTRSIRLQVLPNDLTLEVPAGTALSKAFDLGNIEYAYPCGGSRLCGRCRVLFESGAPAPTEEEKKLLPYKEIERGIRLACCAVLEQDARVSLAPAESLHTEHVLTDGVRSDVVVDPEVKKFRCDLPPSTLTNPVSDWARVVEALPEPLREEARPTLSALQKLPAVVKCADEKKGPVTVTLRSHRVIDAHCGDTSGEHYGVAVDLGTTTIAAVLVDLNSGKEVAKSGCLNPQRVFGFDLISRIHAVQTDPANLGELQGKVIGAINDLVEEMCAKVGIEASGLSAMSLAGNTLMSHLFLGIDPTSLGHAPFAGTLRAGVRLEAKDLRIAIHPHAPVYVLPCIGGFVGGDIVADILVSDLQHLSGISVLVDIGTNGEVVVCNQGRLFATSSAAGPAFEGGKISCGMMAKEGAVDHIRFDGEDFQLTTLNSAPALGLCGSGLIEAFARSLQTNLLGMNGRILRTEQVDGMQIPQALVARLQPDEEGAGRIMLAPPQREREGLFLTQADVREFQLGKGAVSAAVSMVLAEVGLSFGDIDRLLVAGAFGNHLNVEDAMAIGLLPELPKEKVFFIGNGSLEGARCVLLNRYLRQRAEQIAEATTWVELAHRPEFQEKFAMAMMLGPVMDY